MLPVLSPSRSAGTNSYPTLFGFSTKNKVASNLLNYVYGIVMVVAVAFAYHALSLILADWNKLFVFLASLSVVGLPYCIKIIMFGRETFELKHALLCLGISVLPAIFDFVGFYSETSIKQQLVQTKFDIVEKINYFNTQAREKLLEDKDKLATQEAAEVARVNSTFSGQSSELERKLLDMKQTAIDEKTGVRSDTTTGKAGQGPRAKELDAEIRRTQASNDLEQRNIQEQANQAVALVQAEFAQKKSNIDDAISEIDALVSADNKTKGLLFQVNNANNFNELSKLTIIVNNAVSNIGAKTGIEPTFVSYRTDDVIQLSFGALFRGEVTALVCFLLAFLLEMVDTIIVYMVRGVRRIEPVMPCSEPDPEKTRFFKIYPNNADNLVKPASTEKLINEKILTQEYKNYFSD